MNRSLTGLVAGAVMLAFPLLAQAASLDYQGVMLKSGVTVEDKSGNTQTIVESNASRAANLSLTFDNVSGIVRKGSIAFNDTGMWIGFGGTALVPAAKMFQGNLLSGGVIRTSGDVAYDMASNTYSGSGSVIEFVGTMALSGAMKNGWSGMYGTPGAGYPGGGMMPGWGGGNGSPIQGGMMPGWGGTMPGWGGMMGGGGTPGYVVPGGGGGMMGGGGGGMMGPSGMMGGGGNPAAPLTGMVGMVKLWVTPTNAAVIQVNSGTPDRSAPVPVFLNIMLPGVRLSSVP